MNKQDIFTLISNNIGVEADNLSVDDDFADDLNCGLSDMIELKLQLEDIIKEKIEDDEFEEIKTIEDLIILLENYDAIDEF